MLTPGFHFSILKDYLTLVNEHARALTSKLLEDVCGTDQPFDIQEYLTLSTIDMICGGFVYYVLCEFRLVFS